MEMEQSVAKKPRKDLSGYAALIVAMTGLITVFVHRPPEDAAKAGYIELTTAILASQAAEKQNHEDIVTLRTYLEDYATAHTSVVTPVSATSAVTPKNTWVTPASPAKPPVVVLVTPAPSAAPPPPIAPQAIPKRIKAADSIAW